MPGKNTTFNTKSLFMNLQASHDLIGTRVIVALDATKAFDVVEWGYLMAISEGFWFQSTLYLNGCNYCTRPQRLGCPRMAGFLPIPP